VIWDLVDFFSFLHTQLMAFDYSNNK
jgi:hypothetical protein